MTNRDDRSPADKATDDKATDKAKASVLEALGTLIGDDGARRDGARRKQGRDTDPDTDKDLPDDR